MTTGRTHEKEGYRIQGGDGAPDEYRKQDTGRTPDTRFRTDTGYKIQETGRIPDTARAQKAYKLRTYISFGRKYKKCLVFTFIPQRSLHFRLFE